MNVLVTGATGFIGGHVCRELIERGHTVRGTHRGEAPSASSLPEVQWTFVGDIDSQTDWSPALRGRIDAIVHLAARVHVMQETAGDPLAEFRRVNVAGTETLARAAAKVRRFVFVSSIGAMGTISEAVLNEQSACTPKTPYGHSKLEAERVLKRVCDQTGSELVIVRPPLVYGPGNPGNMQRLIGLVRRDWPLPFGSVQNRRSFVYVGNLSSAIATCVEHPAAAGQTYLVSDGEVVSTAELIRCISIALGCSTRLWPFPPFLLNAAVRLISKSRMAESLWGSLAVDSGKISRELGWKPLFDMRTALEKTVAKTNCEDV